MQVAHSARIFIITIHEKALIGKILFYKTLVPRWYKNIWKEKNGGKFQTLNKFTMSKKTLKSNQF